MVRGRRAEGGAMWSHSVGAIPICPHSFPWAQQVVVLNILEGCMLRGRPMRSGGLPRLCHTSDTTAGVHGSSAQALCSVQVPGALEAGAPAPAPAGRGRSPGSGRGTKKARR